MSKVNDLMKELCPNGVKKYTIKDICLVTRGRVISKMELQEKAGEYPVYSSQTLNNGVFGKINSYDFDGEYVQWTTDGANAGSIFYRNGKFSVTNVCGLLKIKDEYLNKIRTDYLAYALTMESKKYVNYATSNPKLMSNVMADMTVLIPPLEVQEEIVRIFDKFAELEAELEVELEARKNQYEFWRGTIISNSNGKDGKLIELLSGPITDGPHTTPKFVSEGIPFISASAVHEGKIHLKDAQGFITKEFDNECSRKYKPRKWDVYMVKSGSTTGKVAIVDLDADFNIWSPLAAMRTDNEITSRYLYHLLQTKDVQEQVRNRMSHGSQPNLSMRVLEQFDIKIPTLEEQHCIVNILDKFDKLINDISEGLPAEIELRRKQYEYYRNKLLSFEVCNDE